MSKRPNISLEKSSILWAIRHLAIYGDTDILPVPIEFKAIARESDFVSSKISELDIGNDLRIQVPRRVSVPKVGSDFRMASQLAPLDALVYTALTYSVSQDIENSRISRSRKQSCSYRVKLTADGGFFDEDEGYLDYKKTTFSNLEDPDTTHVLTIDVSDFYSQLSHHRIQNNLDSASVSEDLSNAIEYMLDGFNSNHHSQGIPIGPSASIILAEASMLDMDNYLSRNGYSFCRYVDDFRLFFKSKKEATTALREFSEVLFTNHRLPINSSKTRIWEKNDFMGEEFINEEELEKEEKLKKLRAIAFTRQGASGAEYQPDEKDQNLAQRQAVDELFQRVKADEPLPLGLARFVLRRARALRSNKIIDGILEDAEKFAPVLRDVCFYFDAVDKNNKSGSYIELINAMLGSGDLSSMAFVQEWCSYAILKNKIMNTWDDVEGFLKDFDSTILMRYRPLLATRYNLWDVIREMKEKIDGYGDSTKRSIILSSCILGKDEKTHWLSRFTQNYDPVTHSCANFAKVNKSLDSIF